MPDDISDFNITGWPTRIGPKGYGLIHTRGYWNLKRGDIKPYISFKAMIDGEEYRFTVWPRRPDSYPTAKIIRRELLRESAIRSQEDGLLEEIELPEKED